MAGDRRTLVSIIVPTYNAERYIRECLDSCLLQQWHNIEIIVVDDCSTDATLKIASIYAAWYPQVRVFGNKENMGEYVTTNKAIKQSYGEFIAFLDCDDMLPRWSIRARAMMLEEHEFADVAYGPVTCFQDERSYCLLDLENYPKGFERYPFIAPKEGLMYRRRVFTKYGLLYDKAYLHADREFVIRIGLHKPNQEYKVLGAPAVCAVSESVLPMAFYRQRKNGQRSKMKTDEAEHQIFKDRIYELESRGITSDNTEFLA